MVLKKRKIVQQWPSDTHPWDEISKKTIASIKFVGILYYISVGLVSAQYLVLMNVINMLMKNLCWTWNCSASAHSPGLPYDNDSTYTLSIFGIFCACFVYGRYCLYHSAVFIYCVFGIDVLWNMPWQG